MKKLPSVAIVILNWNGKDFLQKFLPSVLASDYSNFSVVIADNASTDDSVQYLQQNYPDIKTLLHKKNEGFAKGYNTALSKIPADYYILLNNDVEVHPNWIRPVIELMESNQLIAACQPKILSYHNKETFEYAGASGGWIDTLGYPFTRGRVFDFCEIDNGQYDDASQIFWASGAAFFIKASAFHEMKGFDDYFFAHQEEIDLCWRLQLSGYKIFVEPRSVVYHVGGGSLPKGNKRKIYLNFRNNLILLSKNLPLSQALWKIPVRLCLDWIFSFKELLSGSSGTFSAIIKAHLHFVMWLLKRRKKRNFPRQRSKVSGIYHGSVIWKYFFKKQRTFSEIVIKK